MPQALGKAAAMNLTSPCRAGQAQDQHVLGEPSFVAGLDGSDTQGKAFFAEQSIAAVSGTIGPDQAFVREMADVLFVDRGARPFDIFLTRCEWCANGVQARHKFAVSTEGVEDFPDPMRVMIRILMTT